MLKLFIVNSEEFNKGKTTGNWIMLPYNQSDLDILFEDIKVKDNNYLICGYVTDLNLDVGKHDRINELNDFYKEYHELTDHDKHSIKVICNDFNYDLIELSQNVGSLKDIIKQYENIS